MEEAAGEDEVGFWVLAEICSSDGEDEVGGASSGCRKLCSKASLKKFEALSVSDLYAYDGIQFTLACKS
ncbi:hypothetical protein L3X38_010176 [Prunus dulcis]|uniref:Uncharacterized protein n=1 Tax=Prunus dulcis TaxID=3755 RepID=A0AAD4WHF4_PRUDU|nr:hypothetical protein L3X38_010176 [Prunus dulcis]